MGQYITQLCKYFKKEAHCKVQQQPTALTLSLKQRTIINYNSDGYDSDFEEEKVTIQKEPVTIKSWKKGVFLGQGSFGVVYQGFDLQTGRVFAVKQIEIFLVDKESLNSFYKEIQVLSLLKHPNIVEYYGCTNDGTHLSIFLEYAGGGSIAQILKKFGKLTESVIQKYTRDILQGLIYLHQKKIIHRDIKGANIIVDTRGVCKLADFGCSLIGQQSYSLKGTPNWMAPEVLNQQESGRYSDIWSLGCVVLEMLTALPPWGHFDNPLQALFSISSKKCPPPFPRNISDNLRGFLECCLQFEPKQRKKAKELLNHPFLQIKSPKKSLKSTRIEMSQLEELKAIPQQDESIPQAQREDQKSIFSDLSSLQIGDEDQQFQ
ncbi:unnamed protein product (macronuclear) [Paramecium tetraurelia]|uniref:Protein kinase domain-containing protein n=1 Tax=Paramecium tetraurelia TaxID=5888 RepID=A0DD07_PARTE|nr:uncharacterized protein GSPATT00015783001 [Paramecium tetraurelia]CAK80924.1 unnamed protein product [Paramecium tetraurelia]|eukprot:XP_001448321.1 hypothetical protein (macronuclear) [Paramecium tetraurelia strain d4-2]